MDPLMVITMDGCIIRGLDEYNMLMNQARMQLEEHIAFLNSNGKDTEMLLMLKTMVIVEYARWAGIIHDGLFQRIHYSMMETLEPRNPWYKQAA